MGAATEENGAPWLEWRSFRRLASDAMCEYRGLEHKKLSLANSRRCLAAKLKYFLPWRGDKELAGLLNG